MILPYTFPGILNKLIPLQFLHSFLSPFPLYNGTIIALTQSFGTLSSDTHTLHTLVSHSNTASPPHFNISLVIPSTPGDLPFFNFFTAFLTSSTPTSNTPFASSFILSLLSLQTFVLSFHHPHSASSQNTHATSLSLTFMVICSLAFLFLFTSLQNSFLFSLKCLLIFTPSLSSTAFFFSLTATFTSRFFPLYSSLFQSFLSAKYTSNNRLFSFTPSLSSTAFFFSLTATF